MGNFITVEESQTLLVNEQSKILEKQSIEVFKFGFGQSPFLPPQEVMNSFKAAVHRKDYSSVQGIAELRESIAKFHNRLNGIEANAKDIFVAPGSKILLWSIMACFKEADVLIPTPAWVSYQPQVKLLGHNSIALSTNFEEKWRVTPDTIEKAVLLKKSKDTIMILNYPGNPDGLSYTEEELKELARVAKKYEILVISDEIYGLLSHSCKHFSFANYYPEKTITTTGLSKWCGAGGWRLGAAICSPGISKTMKDTMIGIGSESYSCAPTPVQIAAITAYQSSDSILNYIKEVNQILTKVGDYTFEKLNKTKIRIHKPDGGFYLFPDFSNYKEKLEEKGIYTSALLTNKIITETGVALLPASAFGFSDTFLATRLAYVDFTPPACLSDFIFEEHTQKLQLGIKKLASWLETL